MAGLSGRPRRGPASAPEPRRHGRFRQCSSGPPFDAAGAGQTEPTSGSRGSKVSAAERRAYPPVASSYEPRDRRRPAWEEIGTFALPRLLRIWSSGGAAARLRPAAGARRNAAPSPRPGPPRPTGPRGRMPFCSTETGRFQLLGSVADYSSTDRRAARLHVDAAVKTERALRLDARNGRVTLSTRRQELQPPGLERRRTALAV